MKSLLLLISLMLLVQAESLEVSADKFTHIDKEHRAVFEGNAHATQGKSRIDAKKFIVYFDNNNTATEYQAIGNVRFNIVRPDQHVKGRCRHLTYRVKEETYLLEGNAKLVDLLNKRQMEGERVFLDNKTGRASAKSGNKGPVKFIFEMKDSGKKKTKSKKK